MYAGTILSMQEVLDGRQCMYEVYFFRQTPEGSTEKMVCQSLFCPNEEEETQQILAERRELLASTHGLDPTSIAISEMPLERVEQMLNHMRSELGYEA